MLEDRTDFLRERVTTETVHELGFSSFEDGETKKATLKVIDIDCFTEPEIVLSLDSKDFYGSDIVLLVEAILELAKKQEKKYPDFYGELKNVCHKHVFAFNHTEDSDGKAEAYKIGIDGKLKPDEVDD